MTNAAIQQRLIGYGLLDPPADGKWGAQSQAALEDFQRFKGLPAGEIDAATVVAIAPKPPDLKFSGDFASRIVKYMVKQGHFVARGRQRYNIVYVEGVDQDGTPNSDAFNQWNDRRILIEIADFVTPKIVGNWLATTEPGAMYTYNPMNPGGAFRIAFGQYKAWRFGRHGRTQYPALVQCGEISGYRDKNKDGMRTDDRLVTGSDMAINQHHGWGASEIGPHSAGCLVGQSIEGHQKFLEILKSDRRYQVNSNYVFYAAVIPGDRLE